jgi:hypothetical protein
MDDHTSEQIELLGHLANVAREVRIFAHQIQADFLNVRYNNGLVLTWHAGELRLAATELPGTLTLDQLQLCLAAWKGEVEYDCAEKGHIVAEGADRCMMCGSEASQG